MTGCWGMLRSWGFRGSLPFAVVLMVGTALAQEQYTEPPLDESDREHWAFQPISEVEVPAASFGEWEQNPIDHFVGRKLKAAGLRPHPKADPRTLLRRLKFDLLGLPPPTEEVVNAEATDFGTLIADLLSRPGYGERWGQHWLDLARFAETDGFEHDKTRPNAWKYRDWVIAALNRDMPYDQFLLHQLAGDEVAPEDPDAKVATMFCLSGPDMPDINLIAERKHSLLNEMTATVGEVFLGLQLGCAQCHDHKYDPITMSDYYALHGIFASSRIPKDFPLIDSARPREAVTAYESEKGKREAEFSKFLEALKAEGLKNIRGRWRDYLESFHEVHMTRKQTLANSARTRELKSRSAGAMFNRLVTFKRDPKWHEHPFFGPWARLSALKGEAFHKLRRAMSENRKDSIHPEVLAILQNDDVKDASELTRRWADVIQRSMTAKDGDSLANVRKLVLDDSGPFSFNASELPAQPETGVNERARYEAAKAKVTQLDATHPGAPGRAMVMLDSGSRDSPIHIRGDFRRPGKSVPRRFLAFAAVADNPQSPLTQRYQQGSGRKQLAEALVDRNNPLTARVIVNWVWRHYFGRGFIQSTDFGLRTPRPEQHALLDFLAARFVELARLPTDRRRQGARRNDATVPGVERRFAAQAEQVVRVDQRRSGLHFDGLGQSVSARQRTADDRGQESLLT